LTPSPIAPTVAKAVRRGWARSMAWWKFGRKNPPTPETVARSLFDVLVAEGVGNDLKKPELFGLSDAWRQSSLVASIGTYRKAVLLLVLLTDAQKEPNSEMLLQAYEGLIFGPSPSDAGLAAMNEVKAAMIEMDALMRAPDPPLSWARTWLVKAGIEEENAINLTLVCTHWLSVIAAAQQSLKAIKVQ
jgi:hypothetical protein